MSINAIEEVNSPLKDKMILFLGSSVTYGYASNGISFADFITKRNGSMMIKEAVSGTTLVDEEDNSYIARLKRIDQNEKVDLLVCQLSTNDATKKKELGTVSSSKEIDSFDTHTIEGAIEYIICYARNTWHCPIAFYTSPKYPSEAYASMVTLLYALKEKWNISIIDLWNNEAFNKIKEEERKLYMADPIHPTRSGYLNWWTPQIEKEIIEIVENNEEKNSYQRRDTNGALIC